MCVEMTEEFSFFQAIYSRLFDEIVAAINRSIPFGDSVNYIGILDIAGFGKFFLLLHCFTNSPWGCQVGEMKIRTLFEKSVKK